MVALIHTWFFSYNPGRSAVIETLFSGAVAAVGIAAAQGAVALATGSLLARLGRTLQYTLLLGLLIGVLLLAIGVGSWLIVADLNRQLRLARQKTDFVSNVSHELKTPLTSIRMFSELLAEGRVDDEIDRG